MPTGPPMVVLSGRAGACRRSRTSRGGAGPTGLRKVPWVRALAPAGFGRRRSVPTAILRDPIAPWSYRHRRPGHAVRSQPSSHMARRPRSGGRAALLVAGLAAGSTACREATTAAPETAVQAPTPPAPGTPRTTRPPCRRCRTRPSCRRTSANTSVATSPATSTAWSRDVVIRVGVTYNRTSYFVDNGVQRGAAYEYLKLFEDRINAVLKTGNCASTWSACRCRATRCCRRSSTAGSTWRTDSSPSRPSVSPASTSARRTAATSTRLR